MKNQLLEDFGDSRSEPASTREAAPRRPVSPEPGAGMQGRRSQVWRGRAPAFDADEQGDSPPSSAGAQARPDETPIPPGFADFASQEPDLSIQYPDEPAPWTERWGRKALGWTSILVLAAGVIGGGFWMYHESQVETTLALVADQSPPAPAVVVPAPKAAPAAAMPVAAAPAPAPPPENLEPAEPIESEAVDASAAAAAAVTAAAAPVVAERLSPARPKAAPRKRPPSRAVAARREPRRVAAAPAPRAVAAAPARTQEFGLEETLRQCRAAGYHATLCMKRGCVATKFGLACRG